MEKEKNSKKIYGAIIGIVTTIGITLFMKLVVFAPQSFDDILKQASNEVNELCPMEVDKETRLNNTVILEGRIFQYNYSLINLHRDSIDVDFFKSSMKPLLLEKIKANPGLEIFTDKGVTMVHKYVDKNGELVASIETPLDIKSEK
ncbi:MAG: hypothetical protein N4A72_09195 [Bacteroidales bacterium]|jgi:hypothetical protein|nr:hypothetical protein [Bacteroidales bacterium]